jgi:hypothetical protein
MIFLKEDYFWDDRAVKMTFMTLLTVKGDKQFVELPKMLNFKDYVHKNLSHELNMSPVCALWVSGILTSKNLEKRAQIVKTVNM